VVLVYWPKIAVDRWWENGFRIGSPSGGWPRECTVAARGDREALYWSALELRVGEVRGLLRLRYVS